MKSLQASPKQHAYPYKRRITKRRLKKRRRKSGRKKWLKKVQALLETNGKKVSIRTLQKVPKRKLARYLRKHFTPEEIAEYIPLTLVYSKHGPLLKLRDLPRTNQRSTLTSKWNPSGLNQESAPHPYIKPLMDINEPLSPSEEVTYEDVLQWTNDFTFEDHQAIEQPDYDQTDSNDFPRKYPIPEIPDPKFIAKIGSKGKNKRAKVNESVEESTTYQENETEVPDLHYEPELVESTIEEWPHNEQILEQEDLFNHSGDDIMNDTKQIITENEATDTEIKPAQSDLSDNDIPENETPELGESENTLDQSTTSSQDEESTEQLSAQEKEDKN